VSPPPRAFLAGPASRWRRCCRRSGRETRVGNFDLVWNDGPIFQPSPLPDAPSDRLNAHLGEAPLPRLVSAVALFSPSSLALAARRVQVVVQQTGSITCPSEGAQTATSRGHRRTRARWAPAPVPGYPCRRWASPLLARLMPKVGARPSQRGCWFSAGTLPVPPPGASLTRRRRRLHAAILAPQRGWCGCASRLPVHRRRGAPLWRSAPATKQAVI
jgi:hypothetical protein